MHTVFPSSPNQEQHISDPSMGATQRLSIFVAPDSGARVGKQLRTMRHKALMATLADAREKAGLTQRELARRLGRAHSFVGKIESGERQLNVLEFCEYADAVQADACDLLRAVMRVRG